MGIRLVRGRAFTRSRSRSRRARHGDQRDAGPTALPQRRSDRAARVLRRRAHQAASATGTRSSAWSPTFAIAASKANRMHVPTISSASTGAGRFRSPSGAANRHRRWPRCCAVWSANAIRASPSLPSARPTIWSHDAVRPRRLMLWLVAAFAVAGFAVAASRRLRRRRLHGRRAAQGNGRACRSWSECAKHLESGRLARTAPRGHRSHSWDCRGHAAPARHRVAALWRERHEHPGPCCRGLCSSAGCRGAVRDRCQASDTRRSGQRAAE